MIKWSVIGIAASLLLFPFIVGMVEASPSQQVARSFTVDRSVDRLSASASWTPSEGAEHQLFFYIGLLLLGEDDTLGFGLDLASYGEMSLAGDADSLVIEGLDPKREYVYAVGREVREDDGKRVWSEWLISWSALNPTSVATDREALVALYNATDGDNWRQSDNWLSDAELGDWHGVETDANGRVVSLSLWLNNLNGELPSELGNLAKLEELNLLFNSLGGGVPSELGNLASLKELILMGNEFTGNIPFGLGGLLKLEKLYLSVGNQFSGCVPDSLRNVAENDLSGLGLSFCS